MPNETNEFTNPDGERLIFRKTSKDTDGELLEMEATYIPNSQRPPLHYHPFQDEHFEVLRGTFQARIDETEHTYQPGDKFTVPATTPHWMHNISDEEGCLSWLQGISIRRHPSTAALPVLIRNSKWERSSLVSPW